MAALLVAALAAASVSAATSSPKASQVAGKGWNITKKTGALRNVGPGQFTPSVPHAVQPLIKGQAPQKGGALYQRTTGVNRAIPGKMLHTNPSGSSASSAAGAAAAPFIPHAHSLPITSKQYTAQRPGLNSYDQAANTQSGFALTPPDQALAEGNGFVMEAVNDVLAIYDTNFGHVTNAEALQSFFAPAIFATGADFVTDPQAHYDTVTRKWYVTVAAPGQFSSTFSPAAYVYIAVSTTSDPLSPYNEYVLDVSTDGGNGSCGADACFGDQPWIGFNKNAMFITTNSYDFDTNTFFGSQLYIIDSTALALGVIFPNLVPFDIGANVPTPEGGVCPGFFCWYSVQPGVSPNLTQVTSRGGTEFFMSALDWFGSVDNRVALWALTNTTTISSNFPIMYLDYAIASTESYGFPITDTPFFAPYAEQPSSGNTPTCDFFAGPLCEPGPIANNDDRMLGIVKTITFGQAAHNWAGLNTDALVPDPIGHLHRRSAIAYFDLGATAWAGPFIAGAGVNGQGYIANWNNDVVFPAIGASGNPSHPGAAIVFSLTGNDHFPSVAVSKLGDASPPTAIPVVLAGQDVLDDFAWYFFGTPRYGDYSAAVGDSNTIYLATEYVQNQSCSDVEFLSDFSCGGTRNAFTNWGTGMVKLNV